jgi:integrase
MGRKTVYNEITSPEKISKINKKNMELVTDFLDYMKSIDRAPSTIKNYKADLLVFFCWCLDCLDNKYFVDLTKREIAIFQSYALTEWGWSPNRMRNVKAVLSSLSNYIENILDDEIKGFKPLVRKIEDPVKQPAREKTVFMKDELQKLLDYLISKKQYQKACALALAIASGRRKSELCRLKISYFTPNNIIYDSLYKTPELIKTKGRGKGKFIPIYVTVETFQKYFDMWMEERKRLGIESEWLLINKKEDGSYCQMSTSTLDSWAQTFTNYLGKPFYWHSLRHFFVSELQRAGIPDGVIQEIVNWETADMVKLYSDLTADEQIGKYFGNDLSK